VLARRLLYLLAGLLALTLVAAAAAPPEPVPAPSSTAPSAGEALPPAREVAFTVRERPGGAPTRLRVDVGDTVRLTVHARGPDAVSIDGLTDVEAVEADSPAQIEHLFDEPGRHAVVLLEAGRRLATLDVR
jgi:plastocyanin